MVECSPLELYLIDFCYGNRLVMKAFDVSYQIIEMNAAANFHDLEECICNDEKEHKVKEMAISLLEAMNDWPTADQSLIMEFVQEFKDYFGVPVTIEKIEARRFNGLNAWQIEAGHSIVEMIRISEETFGESTFDAIVEKILSHYE